MPEITYDPSNPDAPEFTPDELDSLQVGEQLAEAEDRMLAGKYENAEQLERAYLELQSKLGSRDEQPDYDEDEEPEGEPSYEYDDEVTDYDGSDEEIASILSDELEENGELSEDTLEMLAENLSVEELIQVGKELYGPQETPDLSERDVMSVQQFAGGEESYNEIISWAGENLDPAYTAAYDSVVDTGDANAITLMLAGIMATYQEQVGYEGRMLSGRNAPDVSGIQPFRSQAEVVAAMSDPRYDSDPAYRNDIAQRLEISNTFFE